MPVFSGPASTLKFSSLPSSCSLSDDRVEGRGHAVVDLDVAHRGRGRQQDRARFDAPLHQAVDQRLAGDRRGGRVLAGVADAVAVVEGAVEGVGRRDRNAVGLGGLDDVVVGADLRRGQDEAVERRVLDDLVQDLDLARRVVGRRLGAEQEDLGADQVGGDGRADIDRIEEAVAGGVRDDGEGQNAVVRVEILGVRALLGRLLEGVAANRPFQRARLGQGERAQAETQREADRGAGAKRQHAASHDRLPLQTRRCFDGRSLWAPTLGAARRAAANRVFP